MNMHRTDFEIGEEITDVRRAPRSGVVISVRLSAEEADRLHDIAESTDRTVSQVAREALSGYLRSARTGTAGARLEVMAGSSSNSSVTLTASSSYVPTVPMRIRTFAHVAASAARPLG